MDTKSTTTNQAAPPGKDSPRSCAADGSAPEYEIKTVQDFLKVPADRMEECLTEFRDFLDLSRETVEACKVVGKLLGTEPPETIVQAFIWSDDGERKGTLRLTVECERRGE